MASSYQYSLHNYRAVMKADIRLDGITVIAGINGCGKSTLSRWLYYLVNTVNNFDSLAINEYISRIQNLSLTISLLANEIAGKLDSNRAGSELHAPMASHYKTDGKPDIDDIDGAKQWVLEKHEQLLKCLAAYLNGYHKPEKEDRILKNLDITFSEGDNIDNVTTMLRERFQHNIDGLANDCTRKLKERSAAHFGNLLLRHNMEVDGPMNISLSEDGEVIANHMGKQGSRIGNLLSLSRAVYVGTPMAIAVNAASPAWWKELRSLMNHEDPTLQLSEPVEDILASISRLLRGEVIYNPNMMGPEKLVLHHNSGKDLPMSQIATGFLTLSYIYRLLANGTLNDKALLIIDEPEAHLHPQWIAELARILVKLNKEVGVKIMIATHQPQFVEALKAIANKEKILNGVRFYLAEQANDNSGQYIYHDIGQDVVDIFKSFNQIYNKIDAYGNEDYD